MISKFFGVVKSIAAFFSFGLLAAYLFTSGLELKDYDDFLAFAMISIFIIICCSYLLYSAIVEFREIQIKKNAFVWIGLVVCMCSLLAISYYWGWAEKIVFGLPLLALLVRDFLLLIKKSAAPFEIAGDKLDN